MNSCRSRLLKLEAESFNRSQWGLPRKAFIFYRTVVPLYWLASLIVCLVRFEDPKSYFIYLSHLGQLAILVYLAAALTCTLVASPHKPTNYAAKKRNAGDKAKWFHWITLALFIISFDNALMVSVSYPFLFRKRTNTTDFANIQKHVVNSLLMLLELFLNKIPVRFLYFPFATAWSLFYALVALSLHWSGVNSAIYEPMDFQNDPIKAWITSIGVVLFCPPLTQLIMCSLYMLKTCLARRFASRVESNNLDEVVVEQKTRTDETTLIHLLKLDLNRQPESSPK